MGVWIPILSIVTYIPLLGALAILFLIPKEQDRGHQDRRDARSPFSTSSSRVPLWFAFERRDRRYQFVEKVSWIPSLGVKYNFGIDGIALLLILLTTLMGIIAVVWSYTRDPDRQKEYYILLLLLQTA